MFDTDKFIYIVLGFILFIGVVGLVIYGTIGAVAWHFISKAW